MKAIWLVPWYILRMILVLAVQPVRMLIALFAIAFAVGVKPKGGSK